MANQRCSNSKPRPESLTSSPNNDADHVASLVKAASTSFYGAMRILPRARREAIFAVYAFCRAVDDIADDEDGTQAERLVGLDRWRRRIDNVYDGQADDAVARALIAPVARYGLARADFLAIIDGMEMDAKGPIVAPDESELDLYCDRVASAVGRLCVCIFGEPGANGRALAHHLGRALQLTNILRDVAEDAALGRLYLPRERLEAHAMAGIAPEAVFAQRGYPDLWREMAARAENAFQQAETALNRCRRRKMRPARIMMTVYRVNLARMRAMSNAEIADPHISKHLVGKREKILLALRHGLF